MQVWKGEQIESLVISPGKAFTDPLLVLLTIALLSLILGLSSARPRRPVAIALVAIVLLWLLSTQAAASMLIRTLLVHEHPETGPDVILVAAAGSALEGLSATSEERVHAAVSWWRRHRGARIIMAGHTAFPPGYPPEPVAMRDEAIRLGVPRGLIDLDLRSRDTREHAIELEKRPGISPMTRVGVVTSDWHMRRTLSAFRRHFKTVIPYPAVTRHSYPFIPGSFLPSSSSLDSSTEALHEWIGIAWYAFRG